jgi:hypothetical protein
MSGQSGEVIDRPWLPFAGLALVAVLFAWLHLRAPVATYEVTAEAADQPLSVFMLREAKRLGLSPAQYFATNSVLVNYRAEAPERAFAYVGDRFQFDFFAGAAPLMNTLFTPFVATRGLSADMVAWYSTVFGALAIALAAGLAWRACGPWHGVLTAAFLLLPLSWLIHTKIGYAAWMPCAAGVTLTAWLAWRYFTRPSLGAAAALGALCGVLYLSSWIAVAFAALLAALVVPLARPFRPSRVVLHGVAGIGAAALALGAGLWLYCAWYHLDPARVMAACNDNLLGRFQQGESRFNPMTHGERIAHAFRLMFLDMTAFEHPDKAMEGQPAVPWFFTAAFVAGLLCCIRDRRPADRFALVWLFATYAPLVALITFAHRYALLGLPALAFIAARGVCAVGSEVRRADASTWRKVYVPMLAAAGAWTLWNTDQVYRNDYLLQKRPEFETDRARGHEAWTAWLKAGHDPARTMVVMSDSIMFTPSQFLYHTIERPYRFAYLGKHVPSGSTAERMKAWEDELLRDADQVVYVLSTVMFPGPDGNPINDPRPFLALHPNLQPAFTYAYAGRNPSILAFVVSRTNSAATAAQ